MSKLKKRKRVGLLALLALVLPLVSSAQDTPSLGQRLGQAIEKAAKTTGALKDYGSPRQVHRGGKPELILKGEHISFNGKPLVWGKSMEEWRSVIGKGVVCSARNERPGWCKWDALGIEIAGSIGKPDQVSTLNVHFNRAADEGRYDLRTQDPEWLSKACFLAISSSTGLASTN